jgi:paraquat-inducible protein B
MSRRAELGAPTLRTATGRRSTWWPGWIWAVPIAAIGIVVWLMLRALSSRGIDVTVSFENAAGMSVNNTRVLYRGLEVGAVSNLELAPDGRHIIATLDIDGDLAPYVNSGSAFYLEGAHPSLSDPSSLKSIISGPSIELVPGNGPSIRHFIGRIGEPPERFAVKLPYLVTFPSPVGGIEVGSPVTFGGFSVGEVASTELTVHPATGLVETRAVVFLDPTRFHLSGVAAKPEDWSAVMNQALEELVRHGLRASLSQMPPLIGSLQVALEMMPGEPPADLDTSGRYPAIPSVEGGGIQAFAAKLGQVPITEIGDNVRAVTAHLRSLASSPQLDDSLRHLDHTLGELDATVRQSGPQVAPTLRSVRQTVDALRKSAAEIDSTAAAASVMLNGSTAAPGGSLQQSLEELTQAARSIRALADYLDRHPEALIRGRR